MKKLLLLSYVALVSALMVSSGFYNRMALLLVATSFCFLLVAARKFYRAMPVEGDHSLEPIFTAALLFLIGFWFVGPTSTDPHPAWYEDLAAGFAGIAFLGVLLGYAMRHWYPQVRRSLFLFLGVLPVILWFLLPQALPVPPIDVYFFHQSASAHVVDGVNPYSVLLGTATYFSEPSAYTYPPANLYPLVLSFLLTGEVRYGQAVLLAATAILLWLVARRTIGGAASELLPLLFLYHPRGIFVLDHSFTETILVFPFALFIFLSVYKLLPAVAALVYGYFISLKPYLFFLSLSWLIIERRPRYLLFGVLGAVAPIVPFLASDFAGTVYNGFFFVLQHVPFRSDSLSASSLLFELCGDCSVPWAGLSMPVGVISAVLTFWFLRRRPYLVSYLYAAVITMLSIFFLGSLAFGGYYYLVSVMMLFLIAVAAQKQSRHSVTAAPKTFG